MDFPLAFGSGIFLRDFMADTHESRRATNTVEVRFEVSPEALAVLDAYNHATGTSRTSVMIQLLEEWSANKLHEATVILRVAGRNPSQSDGRS